VTLIEISGNVTFFSAFYLVLRKEHTETREADVLGRQTSVQSHIGAEYCFQ